VAALHPARGLLVALRRPNVPLLVLALAACAPGSQYALHMAFNQRDGVLPDDAHLGLRHWAALAAATLAVLFTALVAALRADGFVLPAFTASGAVLAWAVTCFVYPNSAGALGPVWAALAVGWAFAFALSAVREQRLGG
jgi:hypothetical protein